MHKNERYGPELVENVAVVGSGNGWVINVNNCQRIKVRYIWWCRSFEWIRRGQNAAKVVSQVRDFLFCFIFLFFVFEK